MSIVIFIRASQVLELIIPLAMYLYMIVSFHLSSPNRQTVTESLILEPILCVRLCCDCELWCVLDPAGV